MGTDFYSLNKVILIGHAFPLADLSKGRGKKIQYIRLQTKEVFIYGKKRPKPSLYYHLIKCSGGLASFCAKYIKPGDLILVEARLRSYPSLKDKSLWKTTILADRVITLAARKE